jgi:hypothetical protein
MKVTLTQRWQGYSVGQVFNMPDGQANLLIRRGVAVPVEQVGTATIPPRKHETAMMEFKGRKRG